MKSVPISWKEYLKGTEVNGFPKEKPKSERGREKRFDEL